MNSLGLNVLRRLRRFDWTGTDVSRLSKARRNIDGVVLHLRDFQDSHRIVEFFSPEEGRLSLMARGARASKKRFAGVLDQFSRLRAVVSPGRDLWSVYEVAPVQLRLNLRTCRESMNRATVLVEWTRILVPEEQAAPEFFRFFDHALTLLNGGELSRAVGVYPRLLDDSGMLPELLACAGCGREIVAGDRAGLMTGEGLACTRCSPRRDLLSSEAIKVIRGARCETAEVALEVERVLSLWLQNEVGQPLRTLSL